MDATKQKFDQRESLTQTTLEKAQEILLKLAQQEEVPDKKGQGGGSANECTEKTYRLKKLDLVGHPDETRRDEYFETISDEDFDKFDDKANLKLTGIDVY